MDRLILAKKKTVKKKAIRKKSTKKKVTRKKAAASKVPTAKSRKKSKSAAKRASAKATRQQKKPDTANKTIAGFRQPGFPEEIYGYKEEDIIGEKIDLVVPEEYRMEMKTCTDNLKLGRLVRPFETVRQKKNGETVTMLVTMSLLRDERGRPEAIATTEHLLTD